MKEEVIKVIKFIYYLISLFAFVCSFFINSIILLIISFQTILMIICSLHELGHIIGCKILKKKIISVRIFSLKIEQKKVLLLSNFNFGGVCSFKKNDTSSKLVYLLGPIFSLFSLLLILFLLILLQNITLLIMLIVDFMVLIITVIPYKHSDIYKYYMEVQNG